MVIRKFQKTFLAISCVLAGLVILEAATASEPDWDVEEIPAVGDFPPGLLEKHRHFEATKSLFRENPEPVFSGLADGRWIEIDYRRDGCFDHDHHTLKVFGGRRPRMKVSTPGLFGDHQISGVVPLSKSDLRGLDVLLSYYRSERRGDCTSRETAKIRWKKGLFFRATTQTETYTDSTCGPHDGGELLRFQDLIDRLVARNAE